MAKFNVVGLDDVMAQVNRRTIKALAKIPRMLESGAGVLVEAQKEEAKSLDIEDTGDFIKSIKADKVKKDDMGNAYIEVFPHGKDSKGESNAEKGFIAEYGRTTDKNRTKVRDKKYKYTYLAPRPWMRTANEKSKAAINEAMLKVWLEEEE